MLSLAGTAGLVTIAFHLVLIVSGNLSWLNRLTIVVCIPTLGGRWPSRLPLSGAPLLAAPLPYRVLMVAVFAAVVVLSVGPARNMLSRAQMMDSPARGTHRASPRMRPRTLAALRRGVEAALVASVPQVLVPKIEERILLPRGAADLGPHLIEALAERIDRNLPEDVKWLSASAFHFGYSAMWGMLYATVRERWRVRPWLGGLGLAAVIHLITFPGWGAAVQLGAVPAPRQRSWRAEIVYLTAPLVFGLGTALLYGEGPRPVEEG